MRKPEFKEEFSRKEFFGKNNRLIEEASKVMNQLYGSNEERLGQLEMVVKTKQFQAKYPGPRGKDVAFIIKQQLSNYGNFC